MLIALGQSVPAKWAAEEARAALAAEQSIDFNVEAVLENTDDCDELFGESLGDELKTEFVAYADVPEDETASRSYALKTPSAPLKRDLDAYRKRRTGALNRFRRGRAVEETTCESDCSCALRFLVRRRWPRVSAALAIASPHRRASPTQGWFRDHRDRSGDDEAPPSLTLRDVWSHASLGAWVESYLDFLDQRKLKWSSRANYITGETSRCGAALTCI